MSALPKKQALLRSAGIVAVFLTVPALLLMFAMALVGAGRAGEVPGVLSDLLTTAGYVWALVLIARWFSRRGVSFGEASGLYWRELPPAKGALAAAGGLGLGFMVSALLALLPLPAAWLQSYDMASLAAFEGRGRLLAVLIAVAASPLCEEILFRGYLLRTLRQGFPQRLAVAATAAVFGLLHVHPLWIAYAFATGLFFGWLACRLHNLAFPICAHMGFNLSALPGIYAGKDFGNLGFPGGSATAALILAGGAAVAAAALHRLIFPRQDKGPDGSCPEAGLDRDESAR